MGGDQAFMDFVQMSYILAVFKTGSIFVVELPKSQL
jgi:hypothetical protein